MTWNPNGGGKRIYPEKTKPNDTSTTFNKVDIVVELKESVSTNTVVHCRILDPDNYIGLGKNDNNATGWTGNDNYGSQGSSGTIIIPSGKKSEKTTLTLSPAHAGDNFIVVASLDSGKVNGATLGTSQSTRYKITQQSDPELAQSELLTVWRTLNVECDVMKYYPGTTNTGTIVTPPSPENYLGSFVSSELARACVGIRNITPSPNTQPPTGHNPMQQAEFNIIRDGVGTGSGRDIAGNSFEYWTVRIVMASAFGGDVYAGFSPGKNTIVLRYEIIKSDFPFSISNINISTHHTLLHELGHLLIDSNEGNKGVMMSPISASEKLLSEYHKFLLDDIQKIQQFSRARD